jgi:hypothetical protein
MSKIPIKNQYDSKALHEIRPHLNGQSQAYMSHYTLARNAIDAIANSKDHEREKARDELAYHVGHMCRISEAHAPVLLREPPMHVALLYYYAQEVGRCPDLVKRINALEPYIMKGK